MSQDQKITIKFYSDVPSAVYVDSEGFVCCEPLDSAHSWIEISAKYPGAMACFHANNVWTFAMVVYANYLGLPLAAYLKRMQRNM